MPGQKPEHPRARHMGIARLLGLVLLFGGSALLGLQACVPAVADAPRTASLRTEGPCFRPDQVTNFRADDGSVYLKVGQRWVYQLDTAGACLDLDTAFRLAVAPTVGRSSLCTGDMAILARPGDTRPVEICRARVTRRLSEEDIDALPSRLRP